MLLIDNIYAGDENDIAGHCKSIISLNIKDTWVTNVGTRLVIKHLPNLVDFKCDDCVTALAQIFQEESSGVGRQSDEMTVRTFGLLNFNCIYGIDFRHDLRYPPLPYVSGRLASAAQLCPFVVHVEFVLANDDISNFMDEDLRALLHLKNLRHLSLDTVWDISFNGGLLPILEKFGPNSLESLKLKYFPDVNFGPIVEHCKKLRSLYLKEITEYNTSQAVPQWRPHHQLPCLEDLRVTQMEDDEEIASADLSFLLLSSPELVTLKFKGLNGTDDQVLDRAALHHGFPRLNRFKIGYCENFSERAIDLLLTLSNPLKELNIDSCVRLTMTHLEAWHKKILDNNWDTLIY